jgi:uncharacterized protein (DUF488 family)
VGDSVEQVLGRYGRMGQSQLVRSVYSRYPWFALNSELPERRLASVEPPASASPAVYTAGYEGKSIDAFLNGILERGIGRIVDVRANPVSRKYGFSGRRFGDICGRLGLEYCHEKELGIPSSARVGLDSFESYQRLLSRYEDEMLPQRTVALARVTDLMRRQPSVLVCVERDVRCCHRTRLANVIANRTGLEVVHL